MNEYEERLQAKKEYYQNKAISAKIESKNIMEKATKMADVIPLGQPVHGQQDRNYRNRIGGLYDKATTLMGKAKYYEQKAESVGTGGISGYDPDAIKKLKEKLEKLEKLQEEMKQINKILRIKNIDTGNAQFAKLGYTDKQIKVYRTPDFAGRIGFTYQLSNNNGNIHNVKERIEQLERLSTTENKSYQTDLYTYEVKENRCQFIFNGKPIDSIRAVLKGNGFKWSPSRTAWVRQATANGLYASKRVIAKLKELTV